MRSVEAELLWSLEADEGPFEATAGESASKGVRHGLARARSSAREWAKAVPDSNRRSAAVVFSRQAFLRFAELKNADAHFAEPCAQPIGRLDTVAMGLADLIGALAAKLSVEEGAHYVSSLYTTLLSSSERSAAGAFYTPPALVRRLLELAEEGGVDWRTARVLDPASGGGAFLLPVATKMRDALSDEDESTVLAHIGLKLCGFELDPHAAWLCQAALDLLLADLARKSGRRVPQLIKVCDALEVPPAEAFDLVIGNPPYGRVTLSPEQRVLFRRSLYGHANLYGVFTDLAMRWTKKGGLIAFLTPTSVLGGQYFASLRGVLAREAPPEQIDFVCSRKGVFEDVLQETFLALYRRGGKAVPIQVHYLQVANECEASVRKNGTVSLPAKPTAPWLAPRTPEQSKLATAASTMPHRLRDWGYSVSTGPLVWNRFKRNLRYEAAAGAYPLIWAESVSADGKFAFRAEKRNHAPFFHAERGDEWLLAREPAVLVQRTTAKEQSRRLIAAQLPASLIAAHGAVVVENHLNMVRAATRKPKVALAVVEAVLNSRVVDQIFRCISGSVAVSAFELEAMPLPSAESMTVVGDLVTVGASRATIDAALAKLYGVQFA